MPMPDAPPPNDPYSEASLAAVMAHARFREACRQSMAASLAHWHAQSDGYRNVVKDVGRLTIAYVAMSVNALTGDRLTAYELQRHCQFFKVASPGRVLEVVRRLTASGDWTLEDGPGMWTRRRIVLQPQFLQGVRGRLACDLDAAVLIWPDMAPFTACLRRDDALFDRFINVAAAASTTQRHLYDPAASPITDLFLQREAGMMILFELACRGQPDPERLLSEAAFSRQALARRFGVSRVHINRMFHDAEDAGWVSFPSSDHVVFAPVMCQAVERLQASIFLLSHETASGLSQAVAAG
jgi:hypothetical protein